MKCQILTDRTHSWGNNFNSPKNKFITIDYFQSLDLLKYLNFEIYKLSKTPRKKVGIYDINYNTAWDNENDKQMLFGYHFLMFQYNIKELKALTNGEIKTLNDIMEYMTVYERCPPVDIVETEYEKKYTLIDVKSYFINRIIKKIHIIDDPKELIINKQLNLLKLPELNNLYLLLYDNICSDESSIPFNIKDYKIFIREFILSKKTTNNSKNIHKIPVSKKTIL